MANAAYPRVHCSLFIAHCSLLIAPHFPNLTEYIAMRYQKFQPAPALHSLVECYFVWEGDAGEGLKVQSPPNCFTSIAFNYKSQYSASQNNTAFVPVPRAFVSGQFTSNYSLELKGPIGVAGIVLKPCALHNIFGIRMSELVNSRVHFHFYPDFRRPFYGLL